MMTIAIVPALACLVAAAHGPPATSVKDIVIGAGTLAQVGDVATIHFVVASQDGKQLADTTKRGLPYSFQIGDPRMLGFWRTGLVGMRVGSERELRVPPSESYGVEGVSPIVPPSATLTVRIVLVAVRKGV